MDSLDPSPCSQELSEEISQGDWFWLELRLWASEYAWELGIAGPYGLDLSSP